MRTFLIALHVLLISLKAFGQPETERSAEALIQDLLPMEENVNYQDAYEMLLNYYSNPLDLNTASPEELQQLYLLTPSQLEAFLSYRKTTGMLLSMYELQCIPGFDFSTISRLLPFVTVREHTTLLKESSRLLAGSNHYILLRYGRNLGIASAASYKGDENRWYIRYKNSKAGSFSYGISLEKDAGEQLYWNSAQMYYGADFSSAHFSLFNRGKIKALTVGDYQVQFGQGLIMSSGFRLGKGAETVLAAKQSNTGARAYSSTSEFGFFRGGIVALNTGPVETTIFYSRKHIDGTIHPDNTFAPYNTGYHRTSSELGKRQSIQEEIWGGNISFNTRSRTFHHGITFAGTQYDRIYKKNPALYSRYDFEGSYNYTLGSDMSWVYKNFIVFAEGAISKSKGKGFVGGIVASLFRNLESTLVIRNYERNFHSFYSNAFGENTSNINEKGIYWGINYKLSPRWRASFYYDQFSFPWLKFQVDAPSAGNEYLGRITYLPSKHALFYVQGKVEHKEKNIPGNSGKVDLPVTATKKNILFHYEVRASELVTLRTRIQASSYFHSARSFGFAGMSELECHLRYFSVSLRYTLFDTDDYDNRQYMYEQDLLYSFSIPAYYGKGSRVYALLRIKLLKNLDCWFKYSSTSYLRSPSSQEDENIAPSKGDVRAQVRYTF